MGLADRHHRARVNPSAPEAFGVCDDCGAWFNRVDLRKQMEYRGDGSTFWLGFYVCRSCEDKPQPQLITPILPADPLPIIEPRPELPTLNFGQMGFQLYELQPFYSLELDTPQGSQAGSPHKTAVLARLASLTGVATPQGYADESGTLAAAQTTQQLAAANPARSWIVVYNPIEVPFVVSTGQASFASSTSGQVLGPGMALYWATAQGLGAAYTGPLTAQGLTANQAFWLFENPRSVSDFSDIGDFTDAPDFLP